MGDDGGSSSGFSKSVRSLLETIDSLEKEIEVVFDRARIGSTNTFATYLRKLIGGTGGPDKGRGGSIDLLKILKMVSASVDTPLVAKGVATALGYVSSELDSYRREFP